MAQTVHKRVDVTLAGDPPSGYDAPMVKPSGPRTAVHPRLTTILASTLAACGPMVPVANDDGATTHEVDTTATSTSSTPLDAGPSSDADVTSSLPPDESTGSLETSTGAGTTTGDEPSVHVELDDPSACLVGGNVLVFDGDRGDFIHPGSAVITDAGWDVYVSMLDEVEVHLTPTDATQGLWWDVWLSSTELAAPLAVGLYTDAMRVPFEDPGHPGMSITGDGRGCNQLSGSFMIHELAFDEAASLRTMTVTWSQYCENGFDELRGCMHFEQ